MHYLLDIPELNVNAFRPECGRMKLYGKSDPPPAPDYTQAAKETAAGNLEAARYATQANRINQYTPYGSLEYTRTPTGEVNQSAYNQAMADYNKNLTAYNAGEDYRSPQELAMQALLKGGGFGGPDALNAPPSALTAPVRPEMDDYKTLGETWSQQMNLTPEAQKALDEQLALNTKYGEVANLGFDRARELFENPQLDTSLLPDRAMDVGQTAQQAIMSRLQPQLEQSEEQLRARLANQGIGLGSTAYGREQNLAGQRRNDLELQAALQGINLDQANRSAALQEQAYLQDRPLNLINALRSGNQVQAPQFQQFAQQATTPGANLLGAADAQYGGALDQYNAGQAQDGGMMSGLLGIAGGFFGGPMGAAAGSAVGKSFSDIRLKTNIRRIGTHPLGIGVYAYEYIFGGGTHVGVMAQEVELVKPEAVFEVAGWKAVDYGRL